MNIGKLLTIGLAGVIALSACVSQSAEVAASMRSSSSTPMEIESQGAGQIDLISLIDPENRRALLPGRSCVLPRRMPLDGKQREALYANEFSCAIEAFQTYYMSYAEYESYLNSQKLGAKSNDTLYAEAVNSLALAVKRNQIQDRIILRSDSLCSSFQRRLGVDLRMGNDSEGFNNWMQGYTAMVVSGAGRLFLNVDAVSVLNNAARYGGVGGFVDDEEKLEATIIQLAIEGIIIERRDRRAAINDQRFFQKGEDEPFNSPFETKVFKPLLESSLSEEGASFEYVAQQSQELQKTVGVVSIGAYSLEQALTDVIDYHAACSVGSGLRQAAKSLEKEINQ